MKPIALILLLFTALAVIAQMPPAPAKRYHAAVVQKGGYTLTRRTIVVVPKPVVIRIMVNSPCNLQSSTDLLTWAPWQFCSSSLSITNPPVTLFVRGVALAHLTLTPSTSLNVTNYQIVEYTTHSPQGFKVYNVGASTDAYIPYMTQDGPCLFEACCEDANGCLSQFSNVTNAQAVQPNLSITKL